MSNQLYESICAGSRDVCSLSAQEVCSLFASGCMNQDQRAALAAMLSRCAAGGEGAIPTEQSVAPTIASTTSSGSTAAGLMEVSVANVGGAIGDIEGVAFPAGASVTYRGYFDEFTAVMTRLEAIDYDATGTEFLISTIP
jgi:hypothetical protein